MALIESIGQAHQLRETLLNRQAGKWLLTQQNPNEFDYYMVAIELLKSDLTSSKYFVFPINPNSIEYNDNSLTKVTKTAGGVSVLKTSQFNIKDITLSGTFGKNFKVLIGNTFQDLTANFQQENSGDKKTKSALGGVLDNFSASVKTGYGCTKVLEDILESSLKRDEYNGSQFLVFYNLAFNQRFFVEFETKSFSQSLESNMMWNYSVRFKVIGNVDNFIKSKNDSVKSIKQLTTDNFLQKSANTVYSKVSGLLSKTYNSATSNFFG